MKNKIYRLSYSWYEEWSFSEFIHPENKSENEFREDVKLLAIKYINQHIQSSGSTKKRKGFKSWIGNDTIIGMLSEKLPELGYIPKDKQFETIDVGLWGSGIIDDDEDGKELKEWIGEASVKSIVDYNKKFSKILTK